MNPRIYDLTNLAAVALIGVGDYLLSGVGHALITVGLVVIALNLTGVLIAGRKR